MSLDLPWDCSGAAAGRDRAAPHLAAWRGTVPARSRGSPPAKRHSPPPAPISSGCEFPRRHLQSAVWDSWFFQRQKHPEGRAFAGFTFDLDLAFVGFDNHFALKHADAKPVFFRRLKRTEQGAVQKLLAHAAAVVGNRQHRPAIRLARLDLNLAGFGNG